MEMNEYQEKALVTAKFPPVGDLNFIYPVLGLAGESGEALEKFLDKIEDQIVDPALKNELKENFARLTISVSKVSEKMKKIIRDKGGILSPADVLEIGKELGDVLWYLSVIAKYIGLTLEEVAQLNIDKLSSRKERNVIHGSGDNR